MVHRQKLLLNSSQCHAATASGSKLQTLDDVGIMGVLRPIPVPHLNQHVSNIGYCCIGLLVEPEHVPKEGIYSAHACVVENMTFPKESMVRDFVVSSVRVPQFVLVSVAAVIVVPDWVTLMLI